MDVPPGEIRPTTTKEITIPYIPKEGERDYAQAFTSEGFRKRLEEGLAFLEATKRADRQRIIEAGKGRESGFVVLSNGKEFVYPELIKGGRLGISMESIDIATGQFGSPPGVDIHGNVSSAWRKQHQLMDYDILGVFHFHPDFSGFSSEDMNEYFSAISAKQIDGVRVRDDYFEGILMPQIAYERSGFKAAKPVTRALRLLAISGPPTSNDYLHDEMDRMGLSRQRQILETSGLRVLTADLPVQRIGSKNLSINLDPLRDALDRFLYDY